MIYEHYQTLRIGVVRYVYLYIQYCKICPVFKMNVRNFLEACLNFFGFPAIVYISRGSLLKYFISA